MNIGILGTGVIASALVRGFCTDAASAASMHFYLSPRNAARAEALRNEFPDCVTVCTCNQEVVDSAEWVFICLIPRQAEAILSELSFRPEQKILSIMSDHTIEKVLSMTGPAAKCLRMVPLPFASMHVGPIAYYPADDEIESMFAPLGKTLSMGREAELSVISGLTGIMSAYYMLIHETARFGEAQGLSYGNAVDYMTLFFEALDIKARAHEDGDIYDLAYEMTPGGLNEMALKSLLSDNAFQPWTDALQKVADRLNKKK